MPPGPKTKCAGQRRATGAARSSWRLSDGGSPISRRLPRTAAHCRRTWRAYPSACAGSSRAPAASGLMQPMTQQQREKAQRLLDAQVEFLEAEIADERFAELVEEEIERVLRDASQLTLSQVVSRDQISAVARKYATAIEINGSIPELMGEIAE